MRTRVLRLAVVVAALAALAHPAASGDDDLATVRACVEANAPKRSTVLAVAINVVEASEEVSETRFKLYWRRLSDGERRVLIRFSAPEDLADAAMLLERVGEKRPRVHLFLPDLGKPQRLTSREQVASFLGRADLGVEEIGMLLDPVGNDDPRLLQGTREIDGRSLWAVESVSGDDENARYARMVVFVDQELCIPFRAEFYVREDAEPKLLSVDPARVTREAESWVPRELVFRDPRAGTVTTLSVEEVEVDVPLAPSLLTVPALARMNGKQ